MLLLLLLLGVTPSALRQGGRKNTHPNLHELFTNS